MNSLCIVVDDRIFFFFQAEDGIRDIGVTEFRRVLFRSAGTFASASFIEVFCYGFLAVLPKVLVSYIVGLGIEFAWAQWKHEEIQEGYLVSGIIIRLIVPVTTQIGRASCRERV